MKALKKTASFFVLFFSLIMANAQYEVKPSEGYSPQIGTMVYMLENLKSRITAQVKDLDQSQTDFLYDKDANSIGSLIMHLVSTEAYYQIETLEGRSWTEEEQMRLGLAGELNTETKKTLRGRPIQNYFDLWYEVRQKTLI